MKIGGMIGTAEAQLNDLTPTDHAGRSGDKLRSKIAWLKDQRVIMSAQHTPRNLPPLREGPGPSSGAGAGAGPSRGASAGAGPGQYDPDAFDLDAVDNLVEHGGLQRKHAEELASKGITASRTKPDAKGFTRVIFKHAGHGVISKEAALRILKGKARAGPDIDEDNESDDSDDDGAPSSLMAHGRGGRPR